MNSPKAIYIGMGDYGNIIKVSFSGRVDDLIEQVEEYMIENTLNLVEVSVKGYHSVDALIRAGFMPGFITDNTKEMYHNWVWMLIDHYIEGFNTSSTAFWFPDLSDINHLIGGQDGGSYYYANIKGWIDFATRTSLSFPLLMYAKDQVYSDRRPKTDMLLFRQVTSAFYTMISDVTSLPRIVIGDSFRMYGLPVTRYAAGMSKGLYYTDENTAGSKATDFCGTFSYIEPESTTYLTFNTYAIYRNKHEAVKHLIGPDALEKFANSTVDQYYNRPEEFPDLSLMMTPSEYVIVKYGDDLKEYDVPFWLAAENRKHYVGRHLDLYAMEDVYDQPLCKAARDKKLDVVILTHMVGAFQIVSEILDTRDRHASFNNLTFPKK